MKKNEFDPLEELFRSELKGLELPPDDSLWDTIRAGLHKKTGRRIILWFSTMAVLITGIVIANPFGTDRNEQPVAITETETTSATVPPTRGSFVKPTVAPQSNDFVNATAQGEIREAGKHPIEFPQKGTSPLKTPDNAKSPAGPSALQSDNETIAAEHTTEDIRAFDNSLINSLDFRRPTYTWPATNFKAKNPLLFTVGLQIGPVLQHNLLKGNETMLALRKKNDKAGFGFQTQAIGEIHFGRRKNFSIYAGFGYMSYTTSASRQKAEVRNKQGDSIVAIAADLSLSYFKNIKTDTAYSVEHTRNSYSYISVPVGLTYKTPLTPRLTLTASAGATLLFLNSSAVNTEFEALNSAYYERKGSFVNKSNLLLNFAPGIEFRASGNYYWNISPYLSYTTGAVNKGMPVSEKHLLYGINFGAKYYFLKK